MFFTITFSFTTRGRIVAELKEERLDEARQRPERMATPDRQCVDPCFEPRSLRGARARTPQHGLTPSYDRHASVSCLSQI